MQGFLRLCTRIGVSFFIDNWYLIVLAMGSGALLLMPAMKGMGGGTLSAAHAVQLINREKAVVVDVRDEGEFAQGHIVGAKHVPLAQLEEKLPQVARNKSLPLVLVCAQGQRAQRGVAVAQKLGYANTQALAGGMKAWRDAQMPIDKA